MLSQFLAISLGKIIIFLTRVLNIGGGSAAPGLYALKFEPNLVIKLGSQIPQNIIITGTNGKTTTARLLSHFLKRSGFKVIRNSTGSNLERGIASTLISASHLSGVISKGIDIGVWELDEAAFNKVVFQLKPQLIIFLNAFRDQLDRYGEVDSVVRNWKSSLEIVDWDPTVLINNSDANVQTLSGLAHLNIQTFGISGVKEVGEKLISQNPVKKSSDFEAKINRINHLEGSEITVSFNNQAEKFRIPIPGIYHIFDFLASFAASYLLNLPVSEIKEGLKNFSPAFGRFEQLDFKDKKIYIFLIKNPAGASLVFETIKPEFREEDTLLIALNDNFADGTDVSWIWDADFEILKSKVAVIASGTRVNDLALRLKYAGFEPNQISVILSLEAALINALDKNQGRIFIMPTYTAMLQLQKILVKKGLKKHYWMEEN
ncbi:DUF1727 domain-containing protein [Candidatus Daviesbacteria bacterium]|nr:DUF1727 domain-containing protein [Candidatus Daviesbacteria bacterium]